MSPGGAFAETDSGKILRAACSTAFGQHRQRLADLGREMPGAGGVAGLPQPGARSRTTGAAPAASARRACRGARE